MKHSKCEELLTVAIYLQKSLEKNSNQRKNICVW